MSRGVKEWIGKTDDSRPPPRVMARVYLKHEGRDYSTGRKIRPGETWQVDHVVALINGGENRESNLAPMLVDKHKEKTRRDVAEKSMVAKKRAKHLGIKPKSPGFKGWRKMNGTVVWKERS